MHIMNRAPCTQLVKSSTWGWKFFQFGSAITLPLDICGVPVFDTLSLCDEFSLQVFELFVELIALQCRVHLQVFLQKLKRGSEVEPLVATPSHKREKRDKNLVLTDAQELDMMHDLGTPIICANYDLEEVLLQENTVHMAHEDTGLLSDDNDDPELEDATADRLTQYLAQHEQTTHSTLHYAPWRSRQKESRQATQAAR
ncbi:hypothetical protein B0H14DRAFT_2594725 [Mycena olivaceomarginata]|nr:hypothetical protein B0H14DRAFT_2594725 [Mycena olivaceomarginata]